MQSRPRRKELSYYFIVYYIILFYFFDCRICRIRHAAENAQHSRGHRYVLCSFSGRLLYRELIDKH